MSLNWNVAAVKDKTKVYRTTCAGCGEPWPCSDSERTDIAGRERAKHSAGDRQFTPLAHAVLYVTMVIQMGEINEKNCAEFYYRVRTYEAVGGPLVTGSYTTLEDIRGLIGLSTNVFPTWPRKRFLSHIAKIALEKAMARLETVQPVQSKPSAD